MTEVKISLLENSHGFFVEALQKTLLSENDPSQWKFAVLCLVQSIELSFKERLRKEHPVLIYSDIDKSKQTVSLGLALRRLKNICAVNIDDKDVSAVHTALEWRNQIVHHECNYSSDKMKSVCATLIGYLSHFHHSVLGQELHDVVPSELWSEAVQIMDFAEQLYLRARKRIEVEKIPEEFVWTCGQCRKDAFVIQDDINTCYVCGTKDEVVECEVCHEFVYLNDTEEKYDYDEDGKSSYIICKQCSENGIADAIAEDNWINQQMDLARGK